MYEMTGTNPLIPRDHRAARRNVLERVLTDVVTALEEDRTPVEIDPVVRTSISLCPGMPHNAFRVPRHAPKS